MQEVSRAMLIKGQKDYPCIFSLENVVLRVRSENGGAWIDANNHTVARYADTEEAEKVLDELYNCVTNHADGLGYRLPEMGGRL